MRGRFPLSLIMIDIDHFKEYNDTYGHLAGDQCLRAVAALISDTVTRPGDVVARFGGEEFVVLLANTGGNEAVDLAEKIRVRIEETIIDNGEAKTQITVSLGVATMVSSQDSGPEALIHTADCALYRAKKEGRNQTVQAG
jgi:diguanylate cyclase (GGDEF)-like protein